MLSSVRHAAARGELAMQDAIFQVQHLSLAYPPRRGHPAAMILDDISVDVERGSALTLVGPSGSGKSSLLRCLNRLEEPTGGVVRFGGRSITEMDPRELRRRAALVQQTAVLFEGSVRDHLMVHAPDATLDVSESRLREALTEVGLDVALLERDAAMLSGGERQRVTIARERHVGGRDDLPLARDPGLTIVAVTHTPELVRRLGGTLLYLVKGRVQAYEPVHDGGVIDERLQAFLSGTHP